MFRPPRTTTFHYVPLPPASSSPSSHPSWTVYAITKKPRPDGPTMKHLHVFVQCFEVTSSILPLTNNLLYSTETSCNSRTTLCPLTSIATGSLQNIIFPPKQEIWKALVDSTSSWSKKNSLPALPLRQVETLWNTSWTSHASQVSNHITHKDIARFQQLFPNAVFHNEDKRATSLRIYCPCIYFERLSATFSDPKIFRKLNGNPEDIVNNTIDKIKQQFVKTYPWALGSGRDLPNAYVLPKGKKQFRSGRPIVSFISAPFRPMLNCIAKLIYQLLPKAFPHNLARGDVFDLIQHLN